MADAPPRFDTRALPAVPASADDRQRLLADGYHETRVAGALVFRKRAGTVDVLADAVGPKAADALRAGGYATLDAARAASDDDLLALDGVGAKTVAKIRATG